nr:claudin-34 [Globicephala melas]
MCCSSPKFPLSWCPVFVCSSLGYTATIPLFINSANHQVVGFVVATIRWILGTTAMSLVMWLVWYMDKTSLFPSDLACVGMWRVCVFLHTNKISRVTTCHHYSYHDNYLPLGMCVVQNLLLVASILGLWEKASIIFPLRNVYMGNLQTLAAGLCIAIGVYWNYLSVMNEEHIAFPPSFNMPFKPDTQRIGSASLEVCLAGFMMLLSGLFFLSYKLPLDSQVRPEVSEMKNSWFIDFANPRLPRVCRKYYQDALLNISKDSRSW